MKREKMWLWVTPGGLAEVAEHGWVPSVTSSLGKAAAALLCLGPCKSSCPAPLQHRLLPAAWFRPSKFWVLAHSPAVSDCSPAELTSGRLVGPYVPAAAPGQLERGGKAVSLGMVLGGEKEDLCAHHPASPQLGEQRWEPAGKRGLRVIVISDPLNCPKPL